jgi:hypothetical protein
MTRLEIAICFFSLVAPALLAFEVLTGIQIPALVYVVPVAIYLLLLLFGKLLYDAVKEDLYD